MDVLNEEVHEEDGHEQDDRLEVGEEEREVMVGSITDTCEPRSD